MTPIDVELKDDAPGHLTAVGQTLFLMKICEDLKEFALLEPATNPVYYITASAVPNKRTQQMNEAASKMPILGEQLSG